MDPEERSRRVVISSGKFSLSEKSCFAFKDKNTLTKSRAIDHLIASKIQQHFIHYSQHIRLILKNPQILCFGVITGCRQGRLGWWSGGRGLGITGGGFINVVL